MNRELNMGPFMHKNRQARIFSMQFLFRLQFENSSLSGLNLLENSLKDFTENLSEGSIPRPSALSFANQIIRGTWNSQGELLEVITQYLKKGNINHIPKIDLTILLQALYEILYIPATPKSVVINEAVELAKVYSSKEGPAFINGLLDSVVKANAYAS